VNLDLNLERDAALVKAQRFKREALMRARRLARADAELSRRRSSHLTDQNGPPFENMLRLLAACKRKSPNAQLEIRASNVWQEGIVDALYVSEVQLNRLGFALEG